MKKIGYISTKAKGSAKFDDLTKYGENLAPVKVKVWTGAAVDAVQLEYEGEPSEKHGGNGGGCQEKKLEAGSYLKKVRVSCGKFGGVDVFTALAFYDQDGRLLAGNERAGDVKELTAGDDEYICALCGETVRAGGTEVINGIGIYTNRLPGIKDLLDILGMPQERKGKESKKGKGKECK